MVAERSIGLTGRALALLLLDAWAARAQSATSGQIQQPSGSWMVPGEIQQPKGTWQTPGAIHAPKDIQAIHSFDEPCDKRLSVLGDALFDFDKATLRLDAKETLTALGPQILKAGKHPITVEGHTYSAGGADYNICPSLQRATAVRDWLAARGFAPAAAAVNGCSKTQPIVPNTPAGRPKNRRVDM